MTHLHMSTFLVMNLNERTCVGASQSPARPEMNLHDVSSQIGMIMSMVPAAAHVASLCRIMTRLHMSTCLALSMNKRTCVGASQSPARAKMNPHSPPSCSDIHDNKQGTSSCTFFEFVKNYDSHSARFVLELLEGSMILYVAHCCPQGEVCRVRICAEVLVFVVDHVLAPQIAQAFIH